ncbi:MAG TPA: Tad domain-containing protein [Bdellovibrionota bacterium]|nr:Tad domain-containing protein [Bdellovibrionota bacterium]
MKKNRKQGQVVLLMGLMATTFVIMFGLVVSIGHLVQAKINLQNAVDLAAMSGASYQARYLNSLSEVNYRFRQNFKWTLFDLYFTMSRYNRGLQQAFSPAKVAAAGPYTLMDEPVSNIAFGICQQSYGYRPMPIIGEQPGDQLRMDFDLCQNVVGAGSYGRAIPKFKPSPVFVPDPRIIITNIAITQLAAEAERIFNVGAQNNPIYFNYAIQQLRIRQDHQLSQFRAVIEQMNQDFSDDPTAMQSGRGGDTVIERTFRDNLINANVDASISYLNNVETRKVALSDFEPAVVGFRIPVVIFRDQGGVFSTELEWRSQSDIPGGYSRKRQAANDSVPQNPTMIVLKATARPRLLFWPRSLTPTISAIAAARPFGSKIGPPKSFYLDENPQVLGATANMSLYVGDVAKYAPGDKIPGIGHVQFGGRVLAMLDAVRKGNGSGVNQLRPGGDGPCPNSFGCMARAPTQYEGIMFNTFITNGTDPRYDLAKTLDLGFSTPVGYDGYNLRDRAKYITGIHNMNEFAGISPYYATPVSALSSWAPAQALDDESSRRIGYSIKLLSMHQACTELGLWGGGAASGTELSFFCKPENAVMH